MVAGGWVEWRAAGGSPVMKGQFRVLTVDMVTQNCMCDKISQDCTHIHRRVYGRLVTCEQAPGWPVCCSHGREAVGRCTDLPAHFISASSSESMAASK